MGPIRVGFFYGAIAALISVFAHFFFLFLDPTESRDWILAATTDFVPLAALTSYVLLGILAAMRARPTYIDSDVPYRSLLIRDSALAAAIVAVIVGGVGFVCTLLQATVFAETIRAFASEAAPRISAYVNEVASTLSDPPPPVSAEQLQALLQPPAIRDLGRIMGNTAIGAIALGALGAVIGALRARSKPESRPVEESGEAKREDG